MVRKLSIAIDGPAAAGKSTIAKKIAARYGYTYIDTGAMYRSVAYLAKMSGIDYEDEAGVVDCLKNMNLVLTPDSHVYLNQQEITEAIRQNDISLGASLVSRYPEVRRHLVQLQRQMAAQGGVVLDGRDIGTVVLPNADLKIYQIASVEARAKRRYLENLEKNIPSSLAQIQAEIEQRDYEDMHRATSPLKKAEDAIELDTSDLTIDEVLSIIAQWIDKKQKEVGKC